MSSHPFQTFLMSKKLLKMGMIHLRMGLIQEGKPCLFPSHINSCLSCFRFGWIMLQNCFVKRIQNTDFFNKANPTPANHSVTSFRNSGWIQKQDASIMFLDTVAILNHDCEKLDSGALWITKQTKPFWNTPRKQIILKIIQEEREYSTIP